MPYLIIKCQICEHTEFKVPNGRFTPNDVICEDCKAKIRKNIGITK